MEETETQPLVGGGAPKMSKNTRNILVLVIALLLFALVLGLGLGLPTRDPPISTGSEAEGDGGAVVEAGVGAGGTTATVGQFRHGAVASDGLPCAGVARDLLSEGGSAVDAAVAALVCNGLYTPQSMGIGGGFLMTVYTRATGKVEVLNARETAPGWSEPKMYHGNSSLSAYGPLSVGVPGEVAGYWAARKKYGNSSISWRRVLQPSITMAREGVPTSATLADSISDKNWKDPLLQEIYTDPTTGKGWVEGQFHKRLRLGETLEALALAGDEGDDLFYRGEIAQGLVQDLEEQGGRLTLEDLASYQALWTPALSVPLSRPGLNQTEGLTLHSFPPPGSGAVLAAVLNIMQHFPKEEEVGEVLWHHRLVEAFKWAYAERSKLGDPEDVNITQQVAGLVETMTSQAWAKERVGLIRDDTTFNDVAYYGGQFDLTSDHGTAHLSVVAPNGDAVAVTSTINQVILPHAIYNLSDVPYSM